MSGETSQVNILLAEDDKNFGIIIKRELEEEGYVVDLVNDGVEAVLRFIGGHYDIFLFDIQMPKLGGIGALRIIKKLDRDVASIAFSGNAGQDEIAEAIDAGARQCFIKPFGMADLIDCMRDNAFPEEGPNKLSACRQSGHI
jgi:two-component system, OmpR family, response regulator